MGKVRIWSAHFAAFSEWVPHRWIWTIAPYPTPMHTSIIAITKTNAIIQYLGRTYKIYRIGFLNELLNHHPNCKHHVKPTICPIGLSFVADDAMVRWNNRDMMYRCLQANCWWIIQRVTIDYWASPQHFSILIYNNAFIWWYIWKMEQQSLSPC